MSLSWNNACHNVSNLLSLYEDRYSESQKQYDRDWYYWQCVVKKNLIKLIHPSAAFYLSRVNMAAGEEGFPDIPLLSNTFQLLLWKSSRDIYSPFIKFQAGLLLVGGSRKTTKGERPGGIPIKSLNFCLCIPPTQAARARLQAPLWRQSSLPYIWDWAQPSPPGESNFNKWYLWSHPVGRYPELMATATHGKCVGVNWLHITLALGLQWPNGL